MAHTMNSDAQKVHQAILRRGIDFATATELAYNILLGWTEANINEVLNNVEGLHNGFRTLKTVHRSPLLSDLRNWQLVRPSLQLMTQAAHEGKALCVDRNGNFKLLESDYVAISHASFEGLYEDELNQGLARTVLSEVFDLIKNTGAEWVWIDSLSIPGGEAYLSTQQHELKSQLINMMSGIYGNASTVVALDATAMHLHSESPVDLAVALLLGRWTQRMWCFQEGRFGKSLTIITRTRAVQLSDLIVEIQRTPDTRNTSGLVPILRTLSGSKERPTLPEITKAFYARDAKLLIDHARSLYPILNLKWDDTITTRDQAMANIYGNYRDEAAQLICSFGAARLREGPGWAPASLKGLDTQLVPDARWEASGIISSWYPYKLQGLRIARGASGLDMACLEGRLEPSAASGPICQLAALGLDNSAVVAFLSMVSSGVGFILAPVSLTTKTHPQPRSADRIGLLAAKVTGPGTDAFQVYLAVKLCDIETIPDVEKRTILISHTSPFPSSSLGDGPGTMVKNLVTDFQMIANRSTPLHDAVRERDMEKVKSLLSLNTDDDCCNARDSNDWTLLHCAIAYGGDVCFGLTEAILDHGASLAPTNTTVKAPLLLAIERAHESVVELLLNRGAPLVSSNGVGPLTQALFSRRSRDLIASLISRGARLSQGLCPLSVYSKPEVVRMLLRSGMYSNAVTSTGGTLLHHAAGRGWPAVIKVLSQRGAYIDIRHLRTKETPLECAVLNFRLPCVKELVALQANVNVRSAAGWPLIVTAARGRSVDIVRVLLQHGANAVTHTTREQQTPLHAAVISGNIKMLTTLLEHFSSFYTVWHKDSDGMLPYHYALNVGRKDMQTVLKDRMAATWKPPPWRSTLKMLLFAAHAIYGLLSAYAPAAFLPEPRQSWAGLQFIIRSRLLAAQIAAGVLTSLAVFLITHTILPGGRASKERPDRLLLWTNETPLSKTPGFRLLWYSFLAVLMVVYPIIASSHGSPLSSIRGFVALCAVCMFVCDDPTLRTDPNTKGRGFFGLVTFCSLLATRGSQRGNLACILSIQIVQIMWQLAALLLRAPDSNARASLIEVFRGIRKRVPITWFCRSWIFRRLVDAGEIHWLSYVFSLPTYWAISWLGVRWIVVQIQLLDAASSTLVPTMCRVAGWSSQGATRLCGEVCLVIATVAVWANGSIALKCSCGMSSLLLATEAWTVLRDRAPAPPREKMHVVRTALARSFTVMAAVSWAWQVAPVPLRRVVIEGVSVAGAMYTGPLLALMERVAQGLTEYYWRIV